VGVFERDVVIIGGGHNGLACAAYLAKAGLDVLVLEKRDVVGGAAATEEPWPGYRVSSASYVVSLMPPQVVRELARSTGVNGMVGGQVIDMDQTGVGEEADPETLHMIHAYKTGALIKSSARIGATLAGTTEDEQASISEYATELGLCFQIVDDLLNATSTREALGKNAGSDAEQGKATFVGVYGLSGAEEEANKAAEKALSALSTVDGDTSGLQELVLFVRHRGH
jgi:geranylgeranyl pyrophosphate synthase